MKNKNILKKMFITILVAMFITISVNYNYAENVVVDNISDIENIIDNANEDGYIELSESFSSGDLTINMPNYDLVIDGKGFSWNNGRIKIQGNGLGKITIKNINIDGENINGNLIYNNAQNGEVELEKLNIYNSKSNPLNINTNEKVKNKLNYLRIYNNESVNSPSAISLGGYTNLDINNSTIENNIGSGGGYETGAIGSKNYRGNLNINNSVFRNNKNRSVNTGVTGGGGGAMSMHYFYGKININESIFDKNQSSGEGIEVKNTYDGGAIYIFDGRDGSTIDIDKTTFSHNIAYDDGGAIMLQGTGNPGLIATIENSTFYGNRAYGLNGGTRSGGAIQLFKNGGSSQFITDINSSTFINNISGNEETQGEQSGGAVATSGAGFFAIPKLNKEDNLFAGNQVYKAGEIFEESKNKDVSGDTLIDLGNKNVINITNKKDSEEYKIEDVLGYKNIMLTENRSDIKVGVDNEIAKSIPIKPQGLADNTYEGDKTIGKKDQKNKERYKDNGAIEISWIKYEANGGKFNLEELEKYDGYKYYEDIENKGYYETYYDVNFITGKDLIESDSDLKLNRDGYTFLGWSKDKEATNPDDNYLIGKEIECDKEDLTLYAIWEKVENKYTMTYDGNGNTSGEVLDIKSPYIENSEVIILDKGNLIKTGYKFKEWNSQKDGLGKTYKAEDRFNITEDTTLYAIWEKAENKYTMTYDGNGNTSGEVLDTKSPYIENSEVIILDKGNLIKTGYKFKEWNSQKDGLGKTYKAEDRFNITEDTTLYAIWDKISVKPPINPGKGTAILANGEKFTDVLTATVLANEKECPILLTNVDEISDETLEELHRIKSGDIIISGGDASVSEKVVEKLSDFNVVRVSGENRYGTAKMIAEEIRDITNIKDEVVLVDGTNFPDVITISSYAAEKRIPIMITEPEKLNNITEDSIDNWNIDKVIIGGGESSVSMNIQNNIKVDKVNRIGGASRYETAINIGDELRKITNNTSDLVLVNGLDFPDGITVNSIASKIKAPILLTNPKNITKSTEETIVKWNVENLIVAGGANSVSEEIYDDLDISNKERISGSDRYITAVKISQKLSTLN